MLRFNLMNRRKLITAKKLSSFCFSADSTNFIKRAKSLEKLKNASDFPNNAFQRGKYMLLLKCESVFVDKNNKLVWKNFQDLESLPENYLLNQKILLGISPELDDIFLFAVDVVVSSDQDVKDIEAKLGGKFLNARQSLIKLSYEECAYVAQATALLHFTKTFKFCPNCGVEVIPNAIGTQKKCQKCKQTHYPHVTPVSIVLLDDVNHENVLLVNQKRHPPGMYSCVAGFIEPGETLQECIKREVAEEIGLNIVNVEFCSSQPWAMPSGQLMLACLASVDGKNLDLDENEIVSAKWIAPDILRGAISQINSLKTETSNTGEFELWVPPSFTASHQLMVEWLKKYHSSS